MWIFEAGEIEQSLCILNFQKVSEGKKGGSFSSPTNIDSVHHCSVCIEIIDYLKPLKMYFSNQVWEKGKEISSGTNEEKYQSQGVKQKLYSSSPLQLRVTMGYSSKQQDLRWDFWESLVFLI